MSDISPALFAAMEAGRLRLQPIVLLDWHDGPLEGIARISDPASFWHFTLVGERPSTKDLDDRIYLLANVSEDAVEQIRATAGASLDEKPLVWPFTDRSNTGEVEASVDAAIASAGPPKLLVQTTTFLNVEGIWRYVEWQSSRDEIAPSGD